MSRAGREYSYWAYGINIRSQVRLPDLIETESAPADVRIRFGKVANTRLLRSLLANAKTFERPGCKINAAPTGMCIDWGNVGTFLVHSGSEVIIEPDQNASAEDLHPFLTGPVLSVLLHQRGLFVLHASAVVIRNVAVGFLGAKGDGKSTLAAHLQVRGHKLIADDITPVDLGSEEPVVISGFPRIKLYGDSITAVGEEPTNFPVIHRFVEKRSFQHSRELSREPIRLHSLYVLCDDEKVGLEKLARPAAFIEITRHTYINRYLKALNCESQHFQQCEKLVQKLPVWKLHRPRDFSVMAEVGRLLENNVTDTSSVTEAGHLLPLTRSRSL
jgi:hypothetical protein